jgi:hypothetical protein
MGPSGLHPLLDGLPPHRPHNRGLANTKESRAGSPCELNVQRCFLLTVITVMFPTPAGLAQYQVAAGSQPLKLVRSPPSNVGSKC